MLVQQPPAEGDARARPWFCPFPPVCPRTQDTGTSVVRFQRLDRPSSRRSNTAAARRWVGKLEPS